MRRFALSVVAAAILCAAAPPPAPPAQPAPAQELTSKPWLYEITRHLYRWYIDERDVDRLIQQGEIVFWVRDVAAQLDKDDRSRFGEVVLPQFAMVVRVKQADYEVPELNVRVKNEAFKIVHVSRAEIPAPVPAGGPEGFVEVRADYAHMRDHLFKTRNLAVFPEGELLEHMRKTAREELAEELAAEVAQGKAPPPPGPQTVFFAPLSPVANEAWVFWETGRKLIRFASDIDLVNPAVWEHEEMAVTFFDLDQNVVVSLDEVAGSNAFMTRDEAGRALFNCIVLGRKVELQPPGAPAAPAP
jgi:hypothetical protein